MARGIGLRNAVEQPRGRDPKGVSELDDRRRARVARSNREISLTLRPRAKDSASCERCNCRRSRSKLAANISRAVGVMALDAFGAVPKAPGTKAPGTNPQIADRVRAVSLAPLAAGRFECPIFVTYLTAVA